MRGWGSREHYMGLQGTLHRGLQLGTLHGGGSRAHFAGWQGALQGEK